MLIVMIGFTNKCFIAILLCLLNEKDHKSYWDYLNLHPYILCLY